MTKYWNSIDATRPAWLGGGQWFLRELQEVTLIFGRNGVGKSLLLRAINENPDYAPAHYSSPERAGEIAYNQNYSEQDLQPSSRGSRRRGRNLAAEYRNEAVSRLGTLMVKLGYGAGRGAEVEQRGSSFKAIEDAISRLLPSFDFKVAPSPPFFELLRRSEDGNPGARVSSVQELSSGETEMLTLALDILTIRDLWELEDQKQRVMLLDEPDPHLHPELQIRFAAFLGHIVRQFRVQLLVATHSTTLLAAVSHLPDVGVGVIYLSNSAAAQVTLRASETLRRLSAVLGGHALMGPLFSAPILLVEGDDDYAIWSQVPRHPGFDGAISVLDARGDQIFEHQVVLETVFASILEDASTPVGFALLDGDKSRPLQAADVHIRFISLACRESENLYLTDEVLGQIGITWGDLQDRIRERATDFGDKAERLLALLDCDRMAVDLKGLMVPLVVLADEKQVPWTLRVGQAIGRRRPIGELERFLGGPILKALWR